MRVAFYAPLKSPDHPVPSGDRRMARAFLALLRDLGHETTLASRFRSLDRDGDPERQRRLAVLGARLAARYRGSPQLWFTYHLYHKAPDHLGPAVSRRLGIPYLVAEASVARKRADGPWAAGYAASLEALAAADLVLAMTEVDRAGLASVVPPSRLLAFPPFLDAAPFVRARAERHRHRARLAAGLGLDPGLPWLLAVAMMRAGAKRDSYRLLADALARLDHRDWRLVVVGDGAAAAEVRALFAPLGEAVRFTGALDEEELPPLYAACDLYVWPAVAEAYGMTLLEAQAAGQPVLAGDEGGVPDIVADGLTGRLAPRRDPAAFAAILADLLARPEERQRLGRAAAARVAERHALPIARRRLAAALDQARRNRAARAAEALPCACA